MKRPTEQELQEKIQRYCAYQERSHQEVRNKLYQLGAFSSQVDKIIGDLIMQGFLNEERFAKAFAGGKFRMKKWGRVKIVKALEQKGVSKNCINIALKEIDDDRYRQALLALLKEKEQRLTEENPFVKKDKLSKFLIQKGYEPALVWEAIRALD